MTRHFSRRSALTIIAAGGASLAAGRARAAGMSGIEVYPVAVPVYQTHFVAYRAGFFKEAGLDVKMIQGGSGVKTREIIASMFAQAFGRRIARKQRFVPNLFHGPEPRHRRAAAHW